MNQTSTETEKGQLLPQEDTQERFLITEPGVLLAEAQKPPRGHQKPGFGGTFIRDRGEGRGPRVAGPKPSDLSLPSPAEVQERLAKPKKVDGIILQTPLRERRTKLAVMGIPSESLQKGTPQYSAMVRNASKYRKARTKELYENFGYVSSGVSSLLAAESLALGSSRFLYEIAASCEPAEAATTLRAAAALADSARQHALCAWELCAKEGKVRKSNADSKAVMPWIVSESGEEKRKPGRPRKTVVALEAAKEME